MSDTDNAGGDTSKRGRGRPSKKSDVRSDKDTSDEPKAKRGRGRPKGTAKKARKTGKASGGSSSGGKRGRGRPKKSDNKSSSDHGGSGDEKDD